ncbi:hypothetical protein LEN26_014799 [Aphanomyces euteiches]|nr:hypothetical protein LEN26_014799 [Aphanomyces euteiches]KAH9123516.1 hypothetical protein AeMF1_005505 [Aphanomyces euteiches]KAH9185206.1 hypothetical protein AeNC1_012819 [Aphanomyces euteiches]
MGVGDSVDEVVQPQDSHPELLDGHSNEAARVTIGKQEITVQLFNATSDIGEIGEIVVRVFQLSRNRVAVGLNLLQAIVGKLEVVARLRKAIFSGCEMFDRLGQLDNSLPILDNLVRHLSKLCCLLVYLAMYLPDMSRLIFLCAGYIITE